MSDEDLTTWLHATLDSKRDNILNGWDSDGRSRVALVATMWTGGEPGYTTVASDGGDGHWVADGREVEDARYVRVLWDPQQELAAIRAHRAILNEVTRLFSVNLAVDCGQTIILKALASAYADQPGFRAEWGA